MSATLERVLCRDGRAIDALAVAGLHAASWRAHYRGSASDTYLDGPIGEERQAFWTRRLATPQPDRILVLAEVGSRLAGFACALTGHDRRWGTLIDNLHVAQDLKRIGLGRTLMRETAARITGADVKSPVHLFVLEANRAARAFYDRMGGEVVAEEAHVLPDGTEVEHPVLRYAWASPRALMPVIGEVGR